MLLGVAVFVERSRVVGACCGCDLRRLEQDERLARLHRDGVITDAEYEAEVRRVQERFRPLVLEAKHRGVALRMEQILGVR